MRLKTFPRCSLNGRTAAHRAMARAALFSNNSLRVRYQRYQHHMQKARALEAEAVSSALAAVEEEGRS